MSSPPVSAARRKQILKVIFVSLLLDLVSDEESHLFPSQTFFRRDEGKEIIHCSHNACRSRSHSFFRYSPNFSNSIVTSKHPLGPPRPPPPPPSLIPFSPTSTLINAPSPDRSTTGTMSSSWVAPWDPSFPSSKPSPLLSLDACPISMAAAKLFCGLWLGTSSPSHSG